MNYDNDDLVDGYSFSQDWLVRHIPTWQAILGKMPEVAKVLEIGSFEGRSTAWFIENAFPAGKKGEIYCIDTWEGGAEHQNLDMSAVEERFLRNIHIARSRARAEVTTHVLKGSSTDQLISLLSTGHRLSFDVIYVDGSHQCADVLSDLVLSFQLCKVDGLIICDDYLWSLEEHGREDLLNQPKLAIDSFLNCYRRKLLLYGARLYQVYIRKTSV